jgi:hypothetical protein
MEASMELGKIIAGGTCGENDCPAIALAEDHMVDVQGYTSRTSRLRMAKSSPAFRLR